MAKVRVSRNGVSIDYSAQEHEEIRRNLEYFGGYSGWIKASRELSRIKARERDRAAALRKEGWIMTPELDLAPLRFVQAGDDLIPLPLITGVNIRDIENQRIVIKTREGEFISEGFHAIEAMMVIKPSALEGRRLRWVRNSFALHNLIIHPVMQIISWLGYKSFAIDFHDRYFPKPNGYRPEKQSSSK